MPAEIIYENTLPAVFIKRNNRFTAEVMIEGAIERVHVKNTGRLATLLNENANVTLQRADNPNRSTKYDLISVYDNELKWVNVDSLVPNKLMHQYLAKRFDLVKPEFKYGNSRIDFYAKKDEQQHLIEIKGCTLTFDAKSGIGYFPDAPTERGIKHLKELAGAIKEGYHCSIDFVIQMNGIDKVLPNDAVSPEFGVALEQAKTAGVEVNFHSCCVLEDRIRIIE